MSEKKGCNWRLIILVLIILGVIGYIFDGSSCKIEGTYFSTDERYGFQFYPSEEIQDGTHRGNFTLVAPNNHYKGIYVFWDDPETEMRLWPGFDGQLRINEINRGGNSGWARERPLDETDNFLNFKFTRQGVLVDNLSCNHSDCIGLSQKEFIKN